METENLFVMVAILPNPSKLMRFYHHLDTENLVIKIQRRQMYNIKRSVLIVVYAGVGKGFFLLEGYPN